MRYARLTLPDDAWLQKKRIARFFIEFGMENDHALRWVGVDAIGQVVFREECHGFFELTTWNDLHPSEMTEITAEEFERAWNGPTPSDRDRLSRPR